MSFSSVAVCIRSRRKSQKMSILNIMKTTGFVILFSGYSIPINILHPGPNGWYSYKLNITDRKCGVQQMKNAEKRKQNQQRKRIITAVPCQRDSVDRFIYCFLSPTDDLENLYADRPITPCENVSSGICGQRRSRSACAPRSLIRLFTVH